MTGAAAATIHKPALSHNLAGQRLGRKGRGTRERILAAADRLLCGPRDNAISLTAVAREASLGMTTLYLYFTDLTELLLAALEPIMASAEDCYTRHLRVRWPDEALGLHAVEFVRAYHAFWRSHARILHLRNSFADANDTRMLNHRIEAAQPLMRLLVLQMDGDPSVPRSAEAGMATVLLTGIERMITVATDANFANFWLQDPEAHVGNLLRAEARLLELGIGDRRTARSPSPSVG